MPRCTLTTGPTAQQLLHQGAVDCLPGAIAYVLMTMLLAIVGRTLPAFSQDNPRREASQWTEQYFDGLRSRGLYSLAETVCHRKLADPKLDFLARCRYAVELSQTLAQHSRTAATLDEQTELLQQARQAISQILESRRNHPQQILLESQLAFVSAYELESLRWRLDLTPYDGKVKAEAHRLADSIIPLLQQLDAQAGEQARNSKIDVLGERLLPYQLRALQRATQLRLGLVFLEKARLLSDSPTDRADALVKSSEILRRLAAISSKDYVMWQSQLAYATTLRLRGTPAAAWSMIDAMREDNPPANVQHSLATEQVELLIVEDRFIDAADYLREYRTKHPQLTGTLNFLMAQVFLRLSQIAEEKNRSVLAAELQQEVQQAIQVATSTGNGYWAARAQNLLADQKIRSTYGKEVGALVREGQALYAKGDLSDSAKRYSQAFAKAQQKKANEIAAEIGYTYGSILLKLKKYAEAANVFSQVTALNKTGARAADADLLVAWCLGMQFRDAPNTERREAYMAALDNHRNAFAESPTAGESTWMLAQLQEQRLQTTKALKLYVSVPSNHTRYLDAMVGIARCSETILNRLRKLKKPRSEWEQAIIGLLRPYVQTAMNPNAGLSSSEADFLIRTARIMISMEQPDFETADGLLQHILASVTSDDSSSQAPLPQSTIEAATGLRIVSLTCLGDTAAATELLKSTVLLNQDRLSGILSGLSAVAEFLPDNQRRNVGTIQLQATQHAGLNPADLSEEQIDTFGPIVASAYEMIGQPSLAIETLKRMLSKQPKDVAMRRRLAELLLTTQKTTDITAAQLQFRKLESSLKAGSLDWMDARIHVIESSILLKNFDEATKLLKVTQLLYPNPGTDELKRRLKEASTTLASVK